MKNNKFSIIYNGRRYTFNKKLFLNNLLTCISYILIVTLFIYLIYYGLTEGSTVGQHLH